MKIFFIEYERTVKFFNEINNFKMELEKSEILRKFIKECKKRNCKLINLIDGEILSWYILII